MAIADLIIQKLGPLGDGIHQGYQGRIFVDRALPGDFVKVRIARDNNGTPRGEVLKVLQQSIHRQKAPCVHYDHCGNCSLQHLNENFYRESKLKVVREALGQYRIFPKRWETPVFAENHKRRRATFTAKGLRDNIVLGYYRRRSQQVEEIDSCLILDPMILEIRDAIKPVLEEILFGLKTIDLFIQKVGSQTELIITGGIGRTGFTNEKIYQIFEDFIQTTTLVRIGWRETENDPVRFIVNRGELRGSFGSLNVSLPPGAFLQPTEEGEAQLVKAVMAALPKKGKFADLFSGCGSFTGPMLRQGVVDAFEFEPGAVKALSKAGYQQALRVTRRDLFKHPLRREELRGYDAVVFDPPRAGCVEQVSHLARTKIPTLIGVSCNPATFARDAKILADGGYRLQSVKIIDQFRWSHHVEMVGVWALA